MKSGSVSGVKWIEIADVARNSHRKIAAAFGPDKLHYDPDTETLALPSRMRDITWKQYDTLLKALPDHRLRHTYDRGWLEMMSPSGKQEKLKSFIGRLIEHMTISIGMRIECFGSATRRRRSLRRGLEPDETYFIAHEPAMRGRFDYRPDRDPPPDLVVEVDLRRPTSRRMRIYAALRVPEIWKYDAKGTRFFALAKSGDYHEIEYSLSFPFISAPDIDRFIDRLPHEATDDVIVSFAKWAKTKYKKPPSRKPRKRKT